MRFIPETVLVACSKSKLQMSAFAQDLYTGSLFQLARQYAELIEAPWLILSARHYVVHPHEIVEPYEETLIGRTKGDRQGWAEITGRKLRCEVFKKYGWPKKITWLAGEKYHEFLYGQLYSFARDPDADGIEIYPHWDGKRIENAFPLAHLGIGQQKQKLKQMIAEARRRQAA